LRNPHGAFLKRKTMIEFIKDKKTIYADLIARNGKLLKVRDADNRIHYINEDQIVKHESDKI